LESSVKTKNRIFGFGKVDIIITVNSTTKTAKGFVIGPLVIVR